MAPSASTASSTSAMFSKGENVLCFHHNLLYQAKVLDVKPNDENDKREGFSYKVHYKGWKNTWDDWVPQGRIRKLTEEHKQLASNLKKEMDEQRRAASGKALASGKKRQYGSDLAGSSATPPPPRGTKRGREIEGIDKEEDWQRRPAVKIFIPDALKSILVDDWEKCTKEKKLPPLPSPTPVTQFLNEYQEAESVNRQPGSADADILEEVIAGIKEYFNKALGRILLYRAERPQFHDIHKELEKGYGDHAGKTLCDVYGCEHLLRLFVYMPDLIAHTSMEAQSTIRLREELSKMTQWLAKRIERYLSTEYEHAGQEYLEGSKTVT